MQFTTANFEGKFYCDVALLKLNLEKYAILNRLSIKIIDYFQAHFSQGMILLPF
jgi:hypothetical protein